MTCRWSTPLIALAVSWSPRLSLTGRELWASNLTGDE